MFQVANMCTCKHNVHERKTDKLTFVHTALNNLSDITSQKLVGFLADVRRTRDTMFFLLWLPAACVTVNYFFMMC